MLLAAIGIYGLMAYSVEQRTQEIGIRLALGAETGAVRNMVVVQGMRLVLIGVAIGIGSAFGLTRFLAAFLFGVNVRDPMAFTAIPHRVDLDRAAGDMATGTAGQPAGSDTGAAVRIAPVL